MADSPTSYDGLSALGMVCALGTTAETIYQNALACSRAGMQRLTGLLPGGESSPFGCVPTLPIPSPTLALDAAHPRCTQLLDLALRELRPALDELLARTSPERIGIVLGTSNSTMEEFTAHPDTIDMATPAHYLRETLHLSGPAYVISTACSSSAKAFSSAKRLLASGTCSAVIVGGVDSFARVVLGGFFALEALSTHPTQPLAADRDGINLGEGAALFILERNRGEIALAGVGESSDAYHLTAPEPSGRGALAAMRAALADANLPPEAIDYINLHGTGTRYNDAMECAAIAELFGSQTPLCSSTKPLTGHTLGAAGAIEAGLCWLMLKHGGRPFPHPVAAEALDPALAAVRVAGAAEASGASANAIRTVLSNAFAFGGSNTSLILQRREGPAAEPEAPVYSLDALLPHRAPMSLLSGYDPASYTPESDRFQCWVIPSQSDLFYDAPLGGIPPVVSVEYMAQAVAAFVGLGDRQQGKTPRVGFFLGTRRLTLTLARFEPGRLYRIHVSPLFSDEAFASFQAEIVDDTNTPCATALLNVFRPDEAHLDALGNDLVDLRPLTAQPIGAPHA